MIHQRIENLNIREEHAILSPDELKAEYPLNETDIQTIMSGQNEVKNILDRTDNRLLVVVGPCSIHDPKAAIEYAKRLQQLSEKLNDTLLIIMRVYFEKPRTNVGWQGLINDPHLDGSYKIEDGLRLARKLLLEITRIGLPVATEALDIVTPPYIQDIISYTAIGARTVESQSHRKMASGLTSAVGIKNATTGDLGVAINAIKAAMGPHNFVSINPNGHSAVVRTNGNPHAHMILRGGKAPNYESPHIAECTELMQDAQLTANILIDFSHANSNKIAARQMMVGEDVATQIENGTDSIRGVMIESNLNEGNQPIQKDLEQLKYGVSITDACIGWDQTEALLERLHIAAQSRS